ncbi:hypothetical protein SETIT_8G166300v2 [Setaria italica]|uniref:Uncharacterized protein n=1 Tax=Setaria italica TaxID=4555 RepID=K3ZLB3_SETIT|nr:hypothetical protein SETIT_8G166300v2 [Setaria italica]
MLRTGTARARWSGALAAQNAPRWRIPPCNGRLPPGSLGLPIVGESFQFFKSSPSLDITDFYKLRLKR